MVLIWGVLMRVVRSAQVEADATKRAEEAREKLERERQEAALKAQAAEEASAVA